MMIDSTKTMYFLEGEELRCYLPILVDILRVNNKNKRVRMARGDGQLVVHCYSMTDDEWNSSVNDLKAWTKMLKIWKETTA